MADLDGADGDSLDHIEHQMALEEVVKTIRIDERLSLDDRNQLIREILARSDADDDWSDDDASAILVRRLGPKDPKGQSGVAVHPEVESDRILEDHPGFHAPKPLDSSSDTAGF